MSANDITNAALALPPSSRAQLAERLLASLDAPLQPGIDELWAQEAEDRIEAYEAGKLRGIPGEKVFRALKARKRQ
jgi:putative addiction module component (TIGR02574 family)